MKTHMRPKQYQSARETLDWTHQRLANAIGKTERHSHRYASGATPIPKTVAIMVRRLVQDRLTMSTRRFDEMVSQL